MIREQLLFEQMDYRRTCLVLLALLAGLAAQPSRFNRLYVFGDSYSDIGEGYLDGNGPTAVAYLANHLGFPLLPANKSTRPDQSLDFAISGAQTGWGDGRQVGTALLGLGMQNQVADFAQRCKEGKIKFDADRTLFFLAGGLNDHNLSTLATSENLKGEIRTLYQLGARHFEIALLPTAIPAFAEVALRLNPALALLPRQLNPQLPLATIQLSHWGTFFDDVMKNSAGYGITDTTSACAGREIFHLDPTPCATPDALFYYHAGHPSTAVHKIVGAKLAAELH